MADDVAPSLLEAIEGQFQNAYNSDTQIKAILERFDKGQGNYQDAQKFAIRYAELLSQAYSSNLSSDVLPDGRMYFNIASRILQPTLEKNYGLISQVSEIAQNQLNQSASIGLKAIRAELNQDRIDGLINRVSSEPIFDDVAWILQSPVNNFCQSVVDDTIEANAKFHYKSGRSPVIRRIATGKCCKWCSALQGTYSYPDDVPDDIYRRHENCRCLVTYDPKDGSNKVQDVHDKKLYSKEDIEERIKKETQNDESASKLSKQKLINKSIASSEAEKLLSKARVKDQVITPILEDAVNGGSGHLEGLDYRIKGKESLTRKLISKSNQKEVSIEEYSKKVTDVLRYTNVSDANKLVNDYKTIVEKLNNKGYNLIEVTNTFNVSGPYKGINTLVKDSAGYVFEFQFHTPQSLEIKEINHKLYEEQRLDSASSKRKQELIDAMITNAEKVDIPIHIDEIKNKK